MPFVDRVNGAITGQYTAAQYPNQEYVADNAPEIVALAQAFANAQAAAQAQATADAAAQAAAKADAVIQYLVTHTPAECAQYVQTNVTSLATAIPLLQKFAMALCVLAKDKLR